jgi:hypothetical protein
MKKERLLNKIKIFLIISIIFLLSKAVILSSCVFVKSLNQGKFRWAAKSSSVMLPYKFEKLYIGARADRKQKVKVYINDRFSQDIVLDEKPAFNTVTLNSGYSEPYNKIEFVAEYGFIPRLLNENNIDNRELSWQLFYIGTDKDVNNFIHLMYPYGSIETEGIHSLEIQSSPQEIKSVLEESLFRWDAVWYVSIIDAGYQTDGDYTKYQNIVWPYIYPAISIIVKNVLDLSPLWAGIITNNLLFYISLFFIYYLSKLLINDTVLSYMPVILLSFHPFSVFLTSAFSEGAFILFTSISMIFLLRKKMFSYSIVAGALNGTRMIGVISPLFLIYDYFVIQKNKPNPTNIFKIGCLSLLSMWGLLSFMIYQKLRFNDFFINFKAAKAWYPVGGKKWSMLYETLANFFRNIENLLDPNILGTALTLFIIVFCTVYFLAKRKTLTRIEHIYILVSMGLLLIAIISQKKIPDSAGRYTLASFPALILLCNLIGKDRSVFVLLWISFSALEMVIMTILFSQGLPPY